LSQFSEIDDNIAYSLYETTPSIPLFSSLRKMPGCYNNCFRLFDGNMVSPGAEKEALFQEEFFDWRGYLEHL
jgi:hypothetical protein